MGRLWKPISRDLHQTSRADGHDRKAQGGLALSNIPVLLRMYVHSLYLALRLHVRRVVSGRCHLGATRPRYFRGVHMYYGVGITPYAVRMCDEAVLVTRSETEDTLGPDQMVTSARCHSPAPPAPPAPPEPSGLRVALLQVVSSVQGPPCDRGPSAQPCTGSNAAPPNHA